MCGIVGGVEVYPSRLKERVNEANQILAHRGPDGQGLDYFELNHLAIALGHSRLSIIDLSELGHQPMSSSDGNYWIIFNGEIYNYKEIREELLNLGYSFKSNTDTEVLLYSWLQWGSSCLTKLTGMFAFVITDLGKKQIYCARDAFGIKPFYYYSSRDSFYFSSEIPSLILLIDDKKSLNNLTVINYLLRGTYDVAENTFVNEINALKPGCFLTINLDQGLEVNESRWWEPSIEENRNISFNDAAQKLRELFLKSVKLHMRSDVPIGAALSGGIDSSAIVCAMRYLEPDIPIHTFSYIASNSSFDEEKWVDIVNNHVNAIPHKLKLSYKDLVEEIDDVISSQGEPFGSTSIYAQYRMFKLAKDTGITVVLEGQGADEMLAGYIGYPEHAAMSYVDKGALLKLFKFLYFWSNRHNKSVWPILEYILSNLKNKLINTSLVRILKRRINKFQNTNTPDWLLSDYKMMEQAYKQIYHGNEVTAISGRKLVHELRRSLMGNLGSGINSLLRHGDRNAMKWGVEGRVPFLTIEIAEFLLSLPEHYLLSKDGLTKNIFRYSMRGIVPDEILDRTDKIGFATPEQEWTSNIKIDYIEKVISGIGFLDRVKILDEVKATLNGSKPFSWFAWRVINLSRWIEINKSQVQLYD